MVNCKKSGLNRLYVLAASVLLNSNWGFADATSTCAHARILKGTNCRTLQVDFDLSRCSDDKSKGQVSVKCNGDAGFATLKTQKYVYRASLKLYQGTLGWDTDGKVTRSPHPPVVEEAVVVIPVAARAPSSVPSAVRTPEVLISGNFDGYYSYNFNRPQSLVIPSAESSNLPASQTQFRNFDIYSNQFALNLAEISVKRSGDEVGFRVDFAFGESVDVLNRQPDTVAVDEVSKHIGQAILSYTPSRLPGFTFNFGKMFTHLGYETTKARDNWQYSRPFLYALAMPYWHFGMSASYSWIPGAFGTSLFVYNGWNSIYDNNQSKTLGAQVALTPSGSFGAYYNLISGPEQPDDTSHRKTIHDLVLTWRASSSLSFAADLLYGHSQQDVLPSGVGDASWSGATVAAKFAPLSWYYVSPRFEVYRDEGGLTSGATQTLRSVTLTNSFTLGEGLETRLEFRHDASTASSFIGKDEVSVSSQTTVTASFLYGF